MCKLRISDGLSKPTYFLSLQRVDDRRPKNSELLTRSKTAVWFYKASILVQTLGTEQQIAQQTGGILGYS